MKHLFIPYELAIIAKRKGFKEYCLAAYGKRRSNGEIVALDNHFIDTNQNVQQYDWPNNENWEDAPLYQQILDWLREKHDIEIYCPNYYKNSPNYKPEYECRVNGKQLSNEYSCSSSVILFPNYYEALNRAIEEAFKLI